MIAAEELDMDMSQLEFVMADTNVTPEQRQALGEQHDQERRARCRAAAASARQALLGLASTQLGVPVSQPVGQQGRRLRRRQVGHLRRSCSAASCSTSTMPASWNMNRDAANSHADGSFTGRHPARAGAGEAGEPVQAGRDDACRGSTSRRS